MPHQGLGKPTALEALFPHSYPLFHPHPFQLESSLLCLSHLMGMRPAQVARALTPRPTTRPPQSSSSTQQRRKRVARGGLGPSSGGEARLRRSAMTRSNLRSLEAVGGADNGSSHPSADGCHRHHLDVLLKPPQELREDWEELLDILPVRCDDQCWFSMLSQMIVRHGAKRERSLGLVWPRWMELIIPLIDHPPD